MRSHIHSYIVLIGILSGCGITEPTFVSSHEGLSTLHRNFSDDKRAMEPRLEDTGLYHKFATKMLAEGIIHYTPRFELYSDGLTKSRFILLPAGSPINPINRELWSYPDGTKIWKEFALATNSGIVRIETRYLVKESGRWKYASYIWNEAQTATSRWGGKDGSTSIPVVLPDTTNTSPAQKVFSATHHTVPSLGECLLCHDQQSSQASVPSGEPPLGFTSFQLSRSFLKNLIAQEQLVDADIPWQAHRTYARSTTERDVIGYLHANCGHCHNPRRPHLIPGAGNPHFVLNYNLETHTGFSQMHVIRQINAPIATSEIGRPVPPGTKLITPREPQKSMLFIRMAHAPSNYRMPLLGIEEPDSSFLHSKLTPWIMSLR